MDFVALLETLSISLCGLAAILWMSIGTLARTRASEVNGQRLIMVVCITASMVLFAMHYMGGALWGSRNAARPMAVFSLVLAAASVLNLKGKEIQGEPNPHSIRRSRAQEFNEEE